MTTMGAKAPLSWAAALLLVLGCAADYHSLSHSHADAAHMPTPSLRTISGTQINFLEVNNPGPKPHVAALLLHGARFSIKTWTDLGTLGILQRHGIHAVAVDLPGFGGSSGPKGALRSAPERASWLDALIRETMPGAKVVIVSPSASGSYAVPYLEKFGSVGDVVGWMPVAPVQIVPGWKLPEDVTSKVEVLAFYGENDPKLPQADIITSLFPNSKKVVVPNGSHPAYLDDAALFHRELMELLRAAGTAAPLHTASHGVAALHR